MKEGWTYKKLGEVCDIFGRIGFRGYTREDYVNTIEEGAISLSPSNIINNRLDFSDCTYITWDKYNQSPEIMISKGDVIFVKTASVGKCAFVSELPHESTINPQFVVFKNIKISNRFLFHELLSPTFQYKVQRIKSGTSVPTITQKGLSELEISYPPLAEQERIVAELDLLSGIIEKKKEQLKAYDQLAQSIFYTMFGDPIDNPKGWEVKTMSDVCASMTKGPFGSDIKKSLFVPKSKDTYKVYIQANAIEKDISLGDYYISKDYFENKMFRFEVKPNDYIITCDGTLGKYIRLPQCIERGIISASLLRLTLNDNINYRYFEHMWDYYILHQQIKDIRNTALKHLPSASKMGKTTIPLPPISLQEVFAEKIEGIERQKALVQQSIEETQTMFDYTMDKYFG